MRVVRPWWRATPIWHLDSGSTHMSRSDQTPAPHALCPDSVAFVACEVMVPLAADGVFDALRNLACMVDWWPGAREMVALPPGAYAAGDVALLRCDCGDIVVYVIAFKAGRRIVLSLQHECRKRWLVDLRVRTCGVGCTVRLSIEALRAPGWLGAHLQGMRLGRVCRTAIEQLGRYLGKMQDGSRIYVPVPRS
ncbi:MAG: hypothetical protein IT478_10265 [Xanthomonadales bacterium]|nr:hypothetical protein [Xanthomonadales bacterium]